MPRYRTDCTPVTHPCAGRRQEKQAFPALPLDLHVLGLSLAFILSQDQTLRCKRNYKIAQNNRFIQVYCREPSSSWLPSWLLMLVHGTRPWTSISFQFLYYTNCINLSIGFLWVWRKKIRTFMEDSDFNALTSGENRNTFVSQKRMQRYGFFLIWPNILAKKMQKKCILFVIYWK